MVIYITFFQEFAVYEKNLKTTYLSKKSIKRFSLDF